MDKEIAEHLVGELEKQFRMVSVDKAVFIDALGNTDVPKSSRFSECVQDNQQLVQESNSHHYLSLRRVLRNENAKDYQLSEWKKYYEAVASALGFYSSDALSRNLRVNRDLVEMMADNKHPFSLLGKFKTYDHNNSKETLFIVTRPVLVIPKATDTRTIKDWEEGNTRYEKEVGLLRHLKRIKPQEYFSQ